jgi:hypothetical protein
MIDSRSIRSSKRPSALRKGALCNLDVSDYNPDDLTLRLRETKNNSDAIVINDENARLFNQYLPRKLKVLINGREPLFALISAIDGPTVIIYKIFMYYKEKAGIQKRKAVFIAFQGIQALC